FPTAPGDAGEHRPDRELVAYHHPDHPVSDQYRVFARELEAQLGTESGKTLLFTAVEPRCGTTSVVLNLAVTLAHQDRCRVAVIDAQFARPACAARPAPPAPPDSAPRRRRACEKCSPAQSRYCGRCK